MDWVSQQRGIALLRSSCTIAFAAAVLFSVCASSLLYATHVKSGTGDKMHVGIRSTADALPVIIANLRGRGFHLVAISELLQ
jgi:hypothetical protein